MKELTEHQACVMFSVAIIAIKFIVFPALYAEYAYQNLYWCIIISSFIDLFFLGVTCWFMKKYPNKTLKEVLVENFGVVITKFLYTLLFIYFFSKSVLILKETHNYFLNNLFDELNWFYFIGPYLLLIGYMGYKTIRTIGRSVELFYWLIAAALILGLILPFAKFKLDNLLPFLNDGFEPIMKGVFKGNFAYGDYLVLIMMFGKIKFTEKTPKRLIKYWAFTSIFVLVFYIAFAGVFNIMGLSQSPAISNLPLNASFPSTVSRLDWVTIIIWTITLIFQTGVYMLFALECFINITGITNKSVALTINVILLFVASLALYLNLELSVKIVTSLPFTILTVSIQVLIPLTLVLIHVKKCLKEKRNAVYKESS